MRYTDFLSISQIKTLLWRTLNALDKLIEQYETGVVKQANYLSCPMCKIHRKFKCRLCPWRVYRWKNLKCTSPHDMTAKENLRRVRFWKRKLEQDLECLCKDYGKKQ